MYGPLVLAKLPTFHNPNKGSSVAHIMLNQMSYCHLLGIYTYNLT
jgi:hypothetical protein